MSISYQAVGWNRQKKIYDLTVVGSTLSFLAVFVLLGSWVNPHATAETLLIRACGAAAFTLLNVILCIGPLCRLDRRFLPLLYNRRHLGVTMFLLALIHGGFAVFQYHALGNLHPLVSVLVGNTSYDRLASFPFQPLGLLALVILALMAATSHDYWLSVLTAPVWKALHMMVYVAYGLIVAHVALGTLLSEQSPWLNLALLCCATVVMGLHVVAGLRERRADRDQQSREGWVDAGPVADIPENRARVISVGGERVAVFRYDGKVSAVSNACQHQNGPLGEGRIIDGCITCPWHGYQYLPHNGSSPPPFREKLPTFAVRLVEGRVLVSSRPLPAGTEVLPAMERR